MLVMAWILFIVSMIVGVLFGVVFDEYAQGTFNVVIGLAIYIVVIKGEE